MVTGTSACAAGEVYSEYVNPKWVRLLDLLDMNVRYRQCLGSELFTADGRRILDFLSGYCVHNAGHNHPAVISAIREELESCGPAMIQSHVAELAGELARSFAGGQVAALAKYFLQVRAVKASKRQSSSPVRTPGAWVCCTRTADFTASLAEPFR